MFTAVGYVFLGVGALLLRQVVVGRVAETPADLKDLFVALVNGDPAAARQVTQLRGENVGSALDSNVASTVGGVISPLPTSLLNECERLGTAAKGYVLGATGPTYYDCSGLVWRAMKNLGIYTGVRFVTANFEHIAPKFATKVGQPLAGDIVIWPGKHMGIATGGDGMYSARSTAKGIGNSTISGDAGYFGSQPHYWRLTSSAKPDSNSVAGTVGGII